MNDFLVFVVDDDPIILEIIQNLLHHDFRVEIFDTAEACLERLKSETPHILLLDVSMPGMDGLTLCQLLKRNPDSANIPVIFVSASDDIDTRLACYEAGGLDFIMKPFEPTELLNKIRITEQAQKEKSELSEQAGFARDAAMSAITSMGELGIVLQFLSRSFSCNTVSELGQAILEALDLYQLSGAAQIRTGEDAFTISPSGINGPLEVSVLNHVRNSGRIFQFTTRCVFNYGNLTLMVNNMPLEDPDRCGRIRDNVALLAEGAAARLKSFEVEQSNRRRQEGIQNALPQVHDALEKIQANYRRNCFELTQVMIEYQEALLKSYVHLGLTQDQEEFITNQARTHLEKMVTNQDQSLVIVGDLEALAQKLEQLAAN